MVWAQSRVWKIESDKMKAIVCSYLYQTNTKPSRVKASDGDGNSVTMSRALNMDLEQNYIQAVIKLCIKMQWHGKLVAGHTMKAGKMSGMVFVWAEKYMGHNGATLLPLEITIGENGTYKVV